MPSAPRPKRSSSASSPVPSASKSSKAKAASSPKAAAPSKASRTAKASKASAASKKAAAPKPAPKAPKATQASKAQAVRAQAPKAAKTAQVQKSAQAPKAATAKAPASKKVKPSKPAPAPVAVAAPPEAPAAQLEARTGGMDAAELLERIVALIHERRGEDVVALDVHGLADYMDYLVIATGRSERQNRSIADGVMRGLKGLKIRPLVRPGPEDGTWICLDFVDVVVHVFDGITRPHYDLENLWGDAPRVPIAAPTLPPAVPQPRQELGAP